MLIAIPTSLCRPRFSAFIEDLLDTLLISPGFVVNQDTSCNKATPSMPMVERRDPLLFVLVAESLRELLDVCLAGQIY